MSRLDWKSLYRKLSTVWTDPNVTFTMQYHVTATGFSLLHQRFAWSFDVALVVDCLTQKKTEIAFPNQSSYRNHAVAGFISNLPIAAALVQQGHRHSVDLFTASGDTLYVTQFDDASHFNFSVLGSEKSYFPPQKRRNTMFTTLH